MIDENNYQIGMRRLERIIGPNRSYEGSDDCNQINECKLCAYVWSTDSKEKRSQVCPSCRTTRWNCEDVREVRCLRCGYDWITSRKKPSKCPSCGSKRWDKETLPIICKKCGMRGDDKMKDGDPIICQVCGDLSPDEYRIGKTRKDSLKDVMEREKCGIPLNEKVLGEMWGTEGDYYRVVLLRKRGLTPEQADIIVRFDKDESIPDIASSMGISVSTVMNSVVPYMELCESMGVRSWN